MVTQVPRRVRHIKWSNFGSSLSAFPVIFTIEYIADTKYKVMKIIVVIEKNISLYKSIIMVIPLGLLLIVVDHLRTQRVQVPQGLAL